MEHKELRRPVAGAKTALLFIHGLIGTPNHFDILWDRVPEDMTVYKLLLDGHGKAPLDFGRTSIRVWERQVREAVDELAQTHENILLVGHSMGTLFAMTESLRCEKIKGLFLIAIPITPWPGVRMITNGFKMYFNLVRPEDIYTNAAVRCYGIGDDKNPFHYYRWPQRYFDLFGKVAETRKLLHRVTVNCTAYQSAQDEMVSRRSIPYLRKHAAFPVQVLEKSGHCYYDPQELTYLKDEFSNFIKENAPK